jgi:hypothetical protein
MLNVVRLIIALFASLMGIALALPVVTICLPFWAAASLTRIISDVIGKRGSPWQQIIEYYPNIGWKPKGNLDTYVFGQDGDVFHFTTDSDGWRGKLTIEESDVVVFGDSFAFGFAAGEETFFANLNQRPLIKTIGVNGYNMVQSLLWMEELLAKLKDKLVIWLVYYGNDLYENLKPNLGQYRMPYVRQVRETGDWDIVTDHVRPDKWIYTSERLYYHKLAEICCHSLLSQRAFSACEYLINRGNAVCKKAGAHLVVVAIPETTQMSESGINRLRSLAPDPKSFDPDLPDKMISEISLRLGVQFVALKNHLTRTDYFIRDCHWNDQGHAHFAKLLSSLYKGYVHGNEGMHAAR